MKSVHFLLVCILCSPMQLNCIILSDVKKNSSMVFSFLKKNKATITLGIATYWYFKNVYWCKDDDFWKTKTFIAPLEKNTTLAWYSPARLQIKNIICSFFAFINSEYNRILWKTIFNPTSFKISLIESEKQATITKAWQNNTKHLENLNAQRATAKYLELLDRLSVCKTSDELNDFIYFTKIEIKLDDYKNLSHEDNLYSHKNAIKEKLKIYGYDDKVGELTNIICNLRDSAKPCDEG